MILYVNFALVPSGMLRESRIMFAAYMYLNSCFKCNVCTKKPKSLGALNSHIFSNHAWKSEIFPKASFGNLNDFVCGF